MTKGFYYQVRDFLAPGDLLSPADDIVDEAMACTYAAINSQKRPFCVDMFDNDTRIGPIAVYYRERLIWPLPGLEG